MDNMAWLQTKIYTRKFFRTLKKESIISIIMGVIITILVMAVTKKNVFETFEGSKSGLFALVCVCIWVGIFNSIQLVCREKNDIVKDELDKSLHATAYMAAHFIYQFFLCLIQSLIVFIIFYAFVADKGDVGSPVAYLITIFLVMYASDAMAFVISTAVPNPIVAMTVMPLLLLIQLVMAGVLFELGDATSAFANLTISKWGMVAFGKIGSITDIKSTMDGKLVDPYSGEAITPDEGWISSKDLDMYNGGMGDVACCWLAFIAFIVVFYFLSVAALKLTTRKVKQ